MKITEMIENRVYEIRSEVMSLIEDQSISLTEKNKKMKPLVDEKRILENTATELKAIALRNYSGRCSDKS